MQLIVLKFGYIRVYSIFDGNEMHNYTILKVEVAWAKGHHMSDNLRNEDDLDTSPLWRQEPILGLIKL